ncbi:hypothetical protein GCM10020254_14750 [Streptomyces goshikiensis]
MDVVEAERVEGLVHPLGGPLRLPHRLALDAASGVAGGVSRAYTGRSALSARVLGYHWAEDPPEPWISTTGVRDSAAGSVGP